MRQRTSPLTLRQRHPSESFLFLRWIFIAVLVWIPSSPARGQSYTIKTIAGGGFRDNVRAVSANLSGLGGMAVTQTGDVFFSLPTAQYQAVFQVDTSGVISRAAGSGVSGYGGDGRPASSAQLYGPTGLATDGRGGLYIMSGCKIRKVSNGVIETAAGCDACGYSGDGGPATSAGLSLVTGSRGIAADSTGTLYILDGESRVRKVAGGGITTIAGDGNFGFAGDGGPAAGARLGPASGIAADSAGNVYIADTSNHRVRKISNGVISTVAGTGATGSAGDNGPATAA
jgi:hypothetical protein